MKKFLFIIVLAIITCSVTLSSCHEIHSEWDVINHSVFSDVSVVYQTSNSNTKSTLKLTIDKKTNKDIACAIEVDGEIVKSSYFFPFTYSKKVKSGTYKIRVLVSENYNDNNGEIVLLDPVKEAFSSTYKVEKK